MPGCPEGVKLPDCFGQQGSVQSTYDCPERRVNLRDDWKDEGWIVDVAQWQAR
jgi:hypothetical protein